MEKILQVTNLSKIYREGKIAIDNLCFDVYEGEILGFLGPNGAGKSTTINIISTLIKPNSGEIVFFNNPTIKEKEVKSKLGIVPQDLAIYEDISAYQNVKFFASLYGIDKKELDGRVKLALERVGLLERKDDKPSTFSGGMKRRLNIACSIAHNPKIIIFDEPTVGIDPQSRNHILESIEELRKDGATIIYTTHYMEEVQQICDRVIIMDAGKILLNDKVVNILHNEKDSTYLICTEEIIENDLKKILKQLNGIYDISFAQKDIRVTLSNNYSISNVLEKLLEKKIKIKDIQKETETLEKVFLNLTGKKLRD